MSDLSVRADFSAWGRFGGAMGRIEPILGQEIAVGMTRLVLRGEAGGKRRIKVDTGHARRSLTHLVRAFAGRVEGRFGTNVVYAEVIEKGRRAGKFPPKGVLVRSGWLRRHGIPDSREYLVRRAIARRGIKPAPYLRPALDHDVMPHLRPEIEAAADRALRRLLGAAGTRPEAA